jgi:BlaI family transcriptional regulator, penicillinase repressor
MPPLPTGAGLGILAALCRLGPSAVREAHNALDKPSGYTTTLKRMQVMTEKGLLSRNERYRTHVYEARSPKEQTRKQIAGDLMRRAFEGSAKDLVLGALSAQPVSDEELAEIRRILKDFGKTGGSR